MTEEYTCFLLLFLLRRFLDPLCVKFGRTMVSFEAMEGLAQSWVEPSARVVSALIVVWYCAGMKR